MFRPGFFISLAAERVKQFGGVSAMGDVPVEADGPSRRRR